MDNGTKFKTLGVHSNNVHSLLTGASPPISPGGTPSPPNDIALICIVAEMSSK